MRLPRKAFFLCLFLACVGSVHAAPLANAPAPPSAAAIPDYGGRDDAPVAASDTAPSPLAQMGRAAEALVIVLAGVVGVVYGLKRFRLVTPGENGRPARIALTGRERTPQTAGDLPVTILSSQTLPGGAMLHVVSVAGRNLLLGATPHTVSALTEWPAEPEAEGDAVEFEHYLARADAAPGGGIAAANARLRSLLAGSPPERNL